MLFRDRHDAGRQLAQALFKYQYQSVIIYAIPRGGVVIGTTIARHLQAPLDLIITRKIGHPLSPEYAIGVVAEDGHTLFNEQEKVNLDDKWLQQAIEVERQEARRRRTVYLPNRKPLSAKNKIAILVDDGIATGLSFQLAIQELKHRRPKKLVAAIPVAPQEAVDQLRPQVDELVVLYTPTDYQGAVGSYYQSFDQVTDEEVIKLVDNLPTSP